MILKVTQNQPIFSGRSAPVITAAVPYNYAATAYATMDITLSGTKFAPMDTTPTVVFAMADCTTTTWTSASSAVCSQTQGTKASCETALGVASIVGKSSSVFSFDCINQR